MEWLVWISEHGRGDLSNANTEKRELWLRLKSHTDVLVNLIKYSNQQLVKNTFLEWVVHEGVVSH